MAMNAWQQLQVVGYACITLDSSWHHVTTKVDVICWIENNASTSKGIASKTFEHQPKPNGAFKHKTCTILLVTSS